MNDSEFLRILRCPETHQPLAVVEPARIEQFNQLILAGRLRNRAGELLTEKIDGGYVRADQKFLYPVRHDIPIMLVDEAIPLSPAS